MKLLSPKSRISFGLVGIMVSLIILAFFFNIIPDRNQAVKEGRSALAETIAVYSAALVKSAKIERLEGDFTLLSERNPDLESLALRHESGEVVVSTGDHLTHWKSMAGEYSKASQIRVPLWSGSQKWGQVELRFKPVSEDGFLTAQIKNPMLRLILFMGGIGFIIYNFFLARVLRQLDPSKAIPGRVRSALDTMAEGLLILDRKEHIVLANQAFTTLVGKTPDALMGFRAGELPWLNKDNDALDKEDRPWVQALKQGQVQRDRTVRLELVAGEYRTFKTNSSPVLGDGGKYAGVLVSFDDITELEEKEVELIKSKQAADEANMAKSSFLANMSHEIRSPMNAILGFTEILKRGYVKNEQESLRYLNTIHSSGKNLLEIINDILDLSKVESGRLEIEKMIIEPYAIIYEVLQMMEVKAQEKKLLLEFKAKGDLPKQIETDPVRLRQIVFNLVGNAIKFTEDGGVTVTCSYVKEKSLLSIDVSDTGIGISEDAVEKIFNPFVQADTSVTRRFGGTGLGLAISRKFAKAMGGDIVAKSLEGAGSSFVVTLSAGDAEDTVFLQPHEVTALQQQVNVSDTTRWQFSQARVLVVDDGEENRELVKLLLGETGIVVDEAVNGKDGLDKALANDYHAILMDVQMPVMDGFTAAGLMREKGLEVPLIALTANAMKGFEEECIQAGYSGYFTKPIDIDPFMELMAELLDGCKVGKEQKSLPRKASEPYISHETTLPLDMSPIVSSLPTNKEKFRSIIRRFVVRLAEQLDAMDAAQAKGDFETLAELAHWLKGAGGTVGFNVFTKPASRLEICAKEGDNIQAKEIVHNIQALAARITVPEETKPVVSRLAGNKRFQPIIIKFVEKLNEKITEMETAQSSADMTELANLAHWLKGAGGTVGYDEFTQPATELEKFAKTEMIDETKLMIEKIKLLTMAVELPRIEAET